MSATEAYGPLFDAHLHIIDPRFPLVGNQGFVPDPFTVEDYRRRTAGLRVTGGAVVSGSFQGVDQSYLLDALRTLGPRFVGVTQLEPWVSDEQITVLNTAGVRAVRFNLFRQGRESLDALLELGHRVAAVAGWHVEVYVDARELGELADRLAGLPRISIDHLGLSTEGLPELLRLVERGARVKATGFGRGDLDVAAALKAVGEVNPEALLFGTDLPSTRARAPFADGDVALVYEALGERLARMALHDNAVDFYHLRTAARFPA
ncbi:amidohydrolase family protein [Streptomyces sp. SAJ15]|uniref:amidohydrolase family protein n=1 Tax=Streptomyces sp. SAJ15 TaxID=2011095 RepID=UPI0011849367|nr:amidohydrolase family protein [Streptomyces sp. SAJ15]TVL91427.1 2-pyrone-4,6-dicarboxylate hydrolase [Streptomyces sp. SAJ15]